MIICIFANFIISSKQIRYLWIFILFLVCIPDLSKWEITEPLYKLLHHNIFLHSGNWWNFVIVQSLKCLFSVFIFPMENSLMLRKANGKYFISMFYYYVFITMLLTLPFMITEHQTASLLMNAVTLVNLSK